MKNVAFEVGRYIAPGVLVSWAGVQNEYEIIMAVDVREPRFEAYFAGELLDEHAAYMTWADAVEACNRHRAKLASTTDS